eukprot:TRINITY_DN8200_c0_g1_i2.p1 TRINITY_DN8200_c0_g1~~TRINITY_DN8200_c0_g1_i2.p1  ORF type:complete len:218 (+),score=41.87 TRINITY_DN8200_c0_g1_i2:95-748(+)
MKNMTPEERAAYQAYQAEKNEKREKIRKEREAERREKAAKRKLKSQEHIDKRRKTRKQTESVRNNTPKNSPKKYSRSSKKSTYAPKNEPVFKPKTEKQIAREERAAKVAAQHSKNVRAFQDSKAEIPHTPPVASQYVPKLIRAATEIPEPAKHIDTPKMRAPAETSNPLKQSTQDSQHSPEKRAFGNERIAGLEARQKERVQLARENRRNLYEDLIM